MALSVEWIKARLRESDPARWGSLIEWRDESTGTPIASGIPDPTTGVLDVLLPFDLFLQGAAAGAGGGEAALAVPGAGSGTAAGQGDGDGVLTQEQPLAGEAGGQGGGSGPAAQEQHLSGEAAGTAGPSGDVDAVDAGALQGTAAGHGDASATPTVSAPLGGTAAGVGGAGPSVLAQQLPIAGSAAGQGGASGTIAALGVSVSDDFNRANGGLGANWVTSPNRSAPQILSNAVSSTALRGAYWDPAVDSFAADQAAIAATPVLTAVNGAQSHRVVVRQSDAAETHYEAWMETGEGWDEEPYNYTIVRLAKVVAGTRTGLADSGELPWVAPGFIPSHLKLTAQGTTITVHGASSGAGPWSLILSVTDSAIASGQPGIDNPNSSNTLDDFQAIEV